jgi:hypothetical protein
MMPKYLVFIMLLLFSCKDSKDVKEISVNQQLDTLSNEKSSKDEKLANPCSKCELAYESFPIDSANFENQFGYPNGTRQQEAYDDIEQFFKCLTICFNETRLENAISLSSQIKYDADGPTYFQSNLINYIENNKELISKTYTKINCSTFSGHINFLFQGIESNSKIKEIGELLSSVKLDENCKKKVISNIPKKASMNDH